ncbi:transferase [Trypanosoma conorhini]|uniref:Transferase n=1 Tax=Trypanosoma conorhini TaxID=83891 RepID=A0A3R7N206_9TRYP|nr:transferase [Trypanosoma conorhini]RNF14704.1 transferase [Trypanosoma conorhini]
MPAEVILMFDAAGVLTTSPYPATRRLAETLMRCVFERAGAHHVAFVGNGSPALLAQNYSNLYSLIRNFTEKVRGTRCAFERLELGEINRVQFVPLYHAEMDFMLTALSKQNMEELESLQIMHPTRVAPIRNRYPLLADPLVQELLRELMDPEAYLCTIEKVTPRRNVLNLLHYLRMKSQQEIRLVVVTNTWEVEGQYARMSKAMLHSMSEMKWSNFPTTCPIDYGGGKGRSSFVINGLFDSFVQSYTFHKRKPFPDIFYHAIEETMKSRMLSRESFAYDVKPHIFLFDDVLENCETARHLSDSPFERVYYVENGAYDVYEDVLSALNTVGEVDPFWADVAAGVQKEMAPFFKPPRDANGNPTSWINEEMNDYNSNLLFLPPPFCYACEPRGLFEPKKFLDEDDKDAILFYCAQHLPQLFPLEIPSTHTENLQLMRKPGFATSCGPIVFEPMRGIGFFKTYRITLRTGSYVLRVQPRGPVPHGTLDIRTEYEMMRYLYHNSDVPIAKCLLYCDSYAACGHRFSLRRFVEGEVITDMRKLTQPRIQRPYSLRRQHINVELNPNLFFMKAVEMLSRIHATPPPRFLSRTRAERISSASATGSPVHPLIEIIKDLVVQYKAVVGTAKLPDGSYVLHSKKVELLSKALLDRFDETRLGNTSIPFPEQLVLIHGDYKLRDLLFSYRSFEGRHKYPAQIIGVMNFTSVATGDPLVDVASLALTALLPRPAGICDMPMKMRSLFPTPGWILDRYCCARGYMQTITKKKREAIFAVYLATACLRYAVNTLSDLGEIFQVYDCIPLAESRNLSLAEQVLQQGLLVMGKRPSRL